MNLDPEIVKQLIQVFAAELDERLLAITEGLIALEKDETGAGRDRCIDSMFRSAHNIKGAARGVDARDIAEIAHALESLFSAMRREMAEVSARTINLCLFSVDCMREAMTAFELQKPSGFDLQTLLQQLNQWQITGEAEADAPLVAEGDKSEGNRGDANDARGSTPDSIASGPRTPSGVSAVSCPESNGGAPAGDALKSTALGVHDADAVREGVVMTRVALHKLDLVSALAEDLLASKIEIEDHLSALQRLHHEAQSYANNWARLASMSPREFESVASAWEQSPVVMAADAIGSLKLGIHSIYKQMCGSSSRLGLISSSLQDQVRTLRLVPLASLLRPLARSIRDIAQDLGKKVEYEVVGDEIEMDRPVLEGIKDPLMHLIRNAIDHGLETPVERLAKGKPEAGRISISVASTGNRILLTVRDDGAGISVAKITAAAVRKKLLVASEAEALTRREALELIFRPGFSSREMITNISGRGVGLDVVLSNLNSLKGSVQIETVEGEGTSFILGFPVSLSTDRGLMVRAGGAEFAIPSVSVVRVMEVDASELIDIEASQAIVIEGKAVPVRDLSAVLELAQGLSSLQQGRLPVVMLSNGWQSVALLVDEIVGERECVVKRLKAPLISIRNVIGGTLTGSGKVVIVLNPGDLVTSALRMDSGMRTRVQTQSRSTVAPHVLVVDDSITTRTLEKNILESQGFRVSIAVDGRLGWEALQKEKFDLVVTDVEMPVMNGFELAGRIKSSERYREIPVIVVTSLASEADRRRGVEVGADAYIVKGQFETKVLLDVINQLI
ncbi:hybrid sensor histidine kinase/response regulator [Candidatus Methylospira mobilis]|uniref:hybrid sensor histidine kinase/response regulator n=1 Tax=Candidatus Methylospira mobilis TaxID=1808979 RepID=UPI0028E67C17|nr:hybrid sensor histidine kinase/response regulator [Candidatus Methylospira mobilis]WNV06440.1 hybrid sensor histidine kinase/response regulator [Candidatus Methylospira mobilis]